MFYVKTQISEDAEIKIEINDNVFTTCPECGKEFKIDLQSLLEDGESDLYSTSVLCKDCADRWNKAHAGKNEA